MLSIDGDRRVRESPAGDAGSRKLRIQSEERTVLEIEEIVSPIAARRFSVILIFFFFTFLVLGQNNSI